MKNKKYRSYKFFLKTKQKSIQTQTHTHTNPRHQSLHLTVIHQHKHMASQHSPNPVAHYTSIQLNISSVRNKVPIQPQNSTTNTNIIHPHMKEDLPPGGCKDHKMIDQTSSTKHKTKKK